MHTAHAVRSQVRNKGENIMTKKRVIKLLMSRGYSRNRAREFQHIRSGKFTNEGILREKIRFEELSALRKGRV